MVVHRLFGGQSEFLQRPRLCFPEEHSSLRCGLDYVGQAKTAEPCPRYLVSRHHDQVTGFRLNDPLFAHHLELAGCSDCHLISWAGGGQRYIHHHRGRAGDQAPDFLWNGLNASGSSYLPRDDRSTDRLTGIVCDPGGHHFREPLAGLENGDVDLHHACLLNSFRGEPLPFLRGSFPLAADLTGDRPKSSSGKQNRPESSRVARECNRPEITHGGERTGFAARLSGSARLIVKRACAPAGGCHACI